MFTVSVVLSPFRSSPRPPSPSAVSAGRSLASDLHCDARIHPAASSNSTRLPFHCRNADTRGENVPEGNNRLEPDLRFLTDHIRFLPGHRLLTGRTGMSKYLWPLQLTCLYDSFGVADAHLFSRLRVCFNSSASKLARF